jgi:GPH family glycoside/pentoside/hexuronide:cation symporter
MSDNGTRTFTKRTLISKISYSFKYVRKYWRTPPKGRFLSFKEFFLYCLGGMGVSGGTVLPTFLTLTAGLYIAAALKISVNDIVLSGIISSIVVVLRGPLVSMIIDNTKSKMGKFRPWIVRLPIPILLSFVATIFIPSALNSSYTWMFITYVIFFNVLQFLVNLYSLSFNTLVQVISPSPNERTQLMSFGSIIYSLGPSLINLLFPLLANYLFSQKNNSGEIEVMGINSMDALKWIIPIFALVCFSLGLITAFGTKERMVLNEKSQLKVKFIDGIKHIAINKYFWLTIISGFLGIFRLVGTTYTAWLATYYIKTEWSQSLLITLIGSANVPGMLLAPVLIKKYGKKALSILSGIFCAIMTIPIVIWPSEPYLVYVMSLLITLANGVNVVVTPALSAQINDYQQYKTGDRLEGFISQVSSMILTGAGIAFAYVTPFIYKTFGYINDTSVLYDIINVTSPIIRWTSVLGVISSFLFAVPFFFWDLSETRHEAIMEILAVRAHLKDGKISVDDANSLEDRIEKGEVGVASSLVEKIFEDDLSEKSLTFDEFVENEIQKKEEKRDNT